MSSPPSPASLLPPLLIVDDSPDDVELLRRGLDKAALWHPVIAFLDSAEALTFLRALEDSVDASVVKPGAMFLDIKMPKIHGFVLLKWVRSQPYLNDMKIIVLSGSDLPEDRTRALALGADAYLVKFPPPAVYEEAVRGPRQLPISR